MAEVASAGALGLALRLCRHRSRDLRCRMRCSRLFIPFVLLFMPLGTYAMTGDKAEFQKLADDVYGFVGKLNDANAMAIVTTQGVVVVDTGNNPPETRLLLKDIRSVTSQPVRYVII